MVKVSAGGVGLCSGAGVDGGSSSAISSMSMVDREAEFEVGSELWVVADRLSTLEELQEQFGMLEM